MNKTVLTNLTQNELRDLLRSWGEPVFHADQVWRWIYRSNVGTFDEMSDLPSRLRQSLQERVRLTSLTLDTERTSKDGKTTKALFRLSDGESVEAVDMVHGSNDEGRRTICVSTQAGCGMGCPFCATGQSGLARNLSAGEIVDQVRHYARGKPDMPVTNIVFMGMGEPLANYNSTLKAIRNLNSPQGFNFGARHLTISTAGVVPGIRRLSREGIQVGLAVSLHAPNDAVRNTLVPVNRRYPLAALLAACRDFYAATGRRVTFEYALFEGMNDSLRTAAQLAALLKGLNCHVNLIPANANEGSAFQPSSRQRIDDFRAELARRGIPVTIRLSAGADIQAGCGQLRLRGRAPSRRSRDGGPRLRNPPETVDQRKPVHTEDLSIPQEAGEDQHHADQL